MQLLATRIGFVCAGILALGLPQLARAGSVITDYSANYVVLQAKANAFYRGSTTEDRDPVTIDFANAAPAYEPHPPYRDFVSAPTFLLPTTGNPKDMIDTEMEATFLFGNAILSDRVVFNIDATLSAENAFTWGAEPAEANHDAFVRVAFFVDANFARAPALPQPPGTTVGFITVPALPTLSTIYEQMTLLVYENEILVQSHFPGGSGGSLPLVTGRSYHMDLLYLMRVPFGVDPTSSYSITVGVVPEPGSMGLIMLGGLLFRRRRAA